MACLVIGLVTLLSHSLKVEITNNKKAAAGQTSDTSKKTVVITSSDAITVNFLTLHIDGFLELSPIFKLVKKAFKVAPVFYQATTSYQHTLFRFIISPNAP
jgi:hypothetical protein